uniref:NADH dehydrogenase [ubiquinone] 1 alpha subcomplex subunit 1 n=1 Tax=Pelusios castaneus TaxID=367368 RepID=A0A8C8R7V5_9SAUR
MWYEGLLGFATLCAFMYIPGLSIIYFQRYENGGKERRCAYTPYQWHLLDRDRRVSGVNQYFHPKGLENID